MPARISRSGKKGYGGSIYVRSAITELVGDARFESELTEEGILFRFIEPAPARHMPEDALPAWVKRANPKLRPMTDADIETELAHQAMLDRMVTIDGTQAV